MNVQHVLFVRTFSDDFSVFGSYAEITNSCAEGSPDLPTRDDPILRPTLGEICQDYKSREFQRSQQVSVDNLPNGLRKIFDWQGAGVYYDSRVNQESLEEFRVAMGIK